MNEYLIGVIHAIDLLCNYWLILLVWLYLYHYKEINGTRKLWTILLIIALLGVIFIPSKETLEILLLNK